MIILASASPRRQELLRLITDKFTVSPTNVDETLPDGIDPEEAVQMLARRKAAAVSGAEAGDIIIGSDTVVVLGDRILGKPHDREEAARMLRALAGRTHRVVTGVAVLCRGSERVFTSGADVTFCDMSDGEINEYLDTGEPFDKAGAYGIQGYGARYISGIRGDYFAVVGLPVHALYGAIREMQ